MARNDTINEQLRDEENPSSPTSHKQEPPKKKKKTKNDWSSLPWKKASLANLRYEDNDHNNDGVGVFLGLEVIPGDRYRIEKSGEGECINVFPTSPATTDAAAAADGEVVTSSATNAKKRKKKKKTKKKRPQAQTTTEETKPETSGTNEQRKVISTSWSNRCSGIELHSTLIQGLTNLNYTTPTPIQAHTLPPAMFGRRNILGAAPTGSGKTLAFGLPILNRLLSSEGRGRALVVAPTRELAMQIYKELRGVCCGEVGMICIVGGLAEVKQKRILDGGPDVVVGTPGRLWELISSGEYPILNDLPKTLRFLVIDEADRMMPMDRNQSGSSAESNLNCFPELQAILSYINDKSKSTSANLSDASNMEKENDDRNIDLLDETHEQEDSDSHSNDDENQIKETPQSTQEVPLHPHELRQTFFFSATLTLPTTSLNSSSKKRKKNRKNADEEDNDFISLILKRAGATGTTKTIDLTSGSTSALPTDNNTDSTSTLSATSSRCLPPGLSLYELKCSQKHKDSFTYACVTTFLSTTGPTLIFCNSISGAKRVAQTLQLLLGQNRIKVLFGNMIQKQRLRALESLKQKGDCSIVVATDVAARGIDIPAVTTIIHYDVARTLDTFIHRSGRTARGVGESAQGVSISLVSPGDEEKRHDSIADSLARGRSNDDDTSPFELVTFNRKLLDQAQHRANLASKIYSYEQEQTRQNSSNEWFRKACKEAELDLDEDLLEDNTTFNDKVRCKEGAIKQQVKEARTKLKVLLAEPMQHAEQLRFGKFLFGSARNFDALQQQHQRKEEDKASYIVPQTKSSRKKRKRDK